MSAPERRIRSIFNVQSDLAIYAAFGNTLFLTPEFLVKVLGRGLKTVQKRLQNKCLVRGRAPQRN